MRARRMSSSPDWLEDMLSAHVVVFAKPVGVVEGRIGEDVVGAEVGMEMDAIADRGSRTSEWSAGSLDFGNRAIGEWSFYPAVG